MSGKKIIEGLKQAKRYAELEVENERLRAALRAADRALAEKGVTTTTEPRPLIYAALRDAE